MLKKARRSCCYSVEYLGKKEFVVIMDTGKTQWYQSTQKHYNKARTCTEEYLAFNTGVVSTLKSST